MAAKYTVIANWKMYLSSTEASKFFHANLEGVTRLAKGESKVVLCPSFVELAEITKLSQGICIGAQDCAEADNGAYTGQISAYSLSELGCKFCIVGHSERRAYNGETSEIVAQKALRALECNMSPIICVGEDFEAYKQGQTFEILKSQLKPIFELFELESPTFPIFFAYEPVWSIGTNEIAPNDYLDKVFEWLRSLLSSKLANHKINLVYGGSVNSKNIKNLIKISQIEGFLLGRASLDFPEFEKIVECCNNE